MQQNAFSAERGSTRAELLITTKAIFFFFAFVFYISLCTVTVPFAYSIYLLIHTFSLGGSTFTNRVGRLWFITTQSLLTVLIGCNVNVLYDRKLLSVRSRKSICISNHTTYIDWLVIWGALFKLNRDALIFVAKESVNSIFFLSLGIKMLDFVLLSRKIDKDTEKIKKACMHLKDKPEYTLVLFPEGTFINAETKRNDAKFLQEQLSRRKTNDPGRPCTLPLSVKSVSQKVIFPRVKGFELFINELNTEIDYFTNCTLYVRSPDKNIYPSEYYTLRRIFSGECPKISFFLVFDYLPVTREVKKDPRAWIHRLFKEKDELLIKMDGLPDDKLSNLEENLPLKDYASLHLRPSTPALIFVFLGACATGALFFHGARLLLVSALKLLRRLLRYFLISVR